MKGSVLPTLFGLLEVVGFLAVMIFMKHWGDG